MTQRVADDVLGKIARQQNDLFRRLREGSLDPSAISRELQRLIEGRFEELPFANEEVASSFGYPAAYRPKPIAEQVAILRRLWPILGPANESLATEPLPQGAEAPFAILRWQKLAPTYSQAVQIVIAKLKERLGDRFHNWREGALTDSHVKLNERTAARLKLLCDQQEGHDILIVPAQFGLRHRGRSVRRARAVFTPSEFGLDPFSVGIMLLTHQERFQKYDDLCVDCAGADYRPSGSGAFYCDLDFRWSGGKLYFNCLALGGVHGSFGSASAFGVASS